MLTTFARTCCMHLVFSTNLRNLESWPRAPPPGGRSFPWIIENDMPTLQSIIEAHRRIYKGLQQLSPDASAAVVNARLEEEAAAMQAV
jgi:hypothetical protein